MLETYFEALQKKLDHYEMTDVEKDEFINHYKDMVERMKEEGKSEREIIDHLPTPKALTEELNLVHEKKRRMPFTDRILMISPLIALGLFLYLGFFHAMWHPGWLSVLLIPGLAICFEVMNDPDYPLFKALIPFMALLGFFVLGFAFSMWLSAWSLLVLIPLIAIVDFRRMKKDMRIVMALAMPFISLFVILNLIGLLDLGAYVWIVLLLNPLIWFTYFPPLKRVLVISALILLGSLYLSIGFDDGTWGLGLLIFLPMLPLMNGTFARDTLKANVATFTLLVLVSVGIFSYFMAFNQWRTGWSALLIIPASFALIEGRTFTKKLRGVAPYLAMGGFLVMGFADHAWHPGWLWLLLMPLALVMDVMVRDSK